MPEITAALTVIEMMTINGSFSDPISDGNGTYDRYAKISGIHDDENKILKVYRFFSGSPGWVNFFLK